MQQAVRMAIADLSAGVGTASCDLAAKIGTHGFADVPEDDLITLLGLAEYDNVLALIICGRADIQSSRLAQNALNCNTCLILRAIMTLFPTHCWDLSVLVAANNMAGRSHISILAPAIAGAALYRPDILCEWHIGASTHEIQDAFFAIQTAVYRHILGFVSDDTYRPPSAIPGRSAGGFTCADVHLFYTAIESNDAGLIARVISQHPLITGTIYPEWLIGRGHSADIILGAVCN